MIYKCGLYRHVSDIANVCSSYGSSLLQKGPVVPRRSIEDILHDAPLDGIDLVSKLLVFNPHKRLTAVQALQHIYVQRYILQLNLSLAYSLVKAQQNAGPYLESCVTDTDAKSPCYYFQVSF
jgi:serine/threonine protein kinase